MQTWQSIISYNLKSSFDFWGLAVLSVEAGLNILACTGQQMRWKKDTKSCNGNVAIQ
jgi:hypothetical protein